jgi:hypothetical protein
MATRCDLCGQPLPLLGRLSGKDTHSECAARREVARQQGIARYQAAIAAALRDLIITPQEWSALDSMRLQWGVAPQDAFDVHRRMFQAGHDHVVQDRVVTAEEVRYLQQLARELRLPAGAIGDQLSETTRLYHLHQLQTGPMPVVGSPPIALQRSEICYWVQGGVEYIEEKTERVRALADAEAVCIVLTRAIQGALG